MKSTIIVIGGLPCSGKTTLGKELSTLLNLPVISKDELEAAIVRKGLASNKSMNGVGYEVMASIAKAHVESGSSVIFDFIASKNRVIECWPSLLNLNVKYVECTCPEEQLHKERIHSRQRNIEGWYELTWEEVLKIKKIYQPMRSERLVLESSRELSANVELARNFIQS